MPKRNTEVLVVGAGPVGMSAALLLNEQGIQVRIIDQGERTTTHSYACVLHPGTLQLLKQWGIDEFISEGRRIRTVAFYDETKRRAELSLGDLHGDFGCAVVLPQSRLEQELERKLARRGVAVEWGHRLSELSSGEEKVVAQIDHMRESGKGYIVPDFEWEIAMTFDLTADFVIGADGYHSQVRRCLGGGMIPMGHRQTFAMFDFETDAALNDEICVMLDSPMSALWPLPDGRCRWSFELTSSELEEFPMKERSRLVMEDAAMDRETRERLHELLEQRAPWFRGSVKELHWTPTAQFEPSLVDRLGEGACWLIGDAAHQTSPLGVQSMNVGLREAGDVTSRIGKILRDGAPTELLEEFGVDRREEWQQLLHPEAVRPQFDVDRWIGEHAWQILSCIPASGRDLAELLGQIHLELPLKQQLHPF